MRFKSIDVLKGGEVLAEPILSEKEDIIMQKGTIIKTEYIPLLMSMGIQTIMVEDPYEHLETPNAIVSIATFEDYVGRIKRIMESHIYHSNSSLREFEMIANEIVKEIQEIPNDIIIDVTERSSDLYEHTMRVTLLSVFLGKRLHFDRQRLYHVALGALLHDIGIRYVTSKYENADFSVMDPVSVFELKKHTILGYSALDGESWIPDIARKMILSHHERIDGTGYPMKQKNKEIECRIIQACDAFDCYISGVECKRKSLQEALSIMEEMRGQAFDKKIIDILLDSVAPYPVGTTVITSQDENGVVISQTKDKNNPIIMVIDSEEENNFFQRNLMLEDDISIAYIS